MARYDAPFRRDTRTPIDEYIRGRDIGREWKFAHTPGGPFVYKASNERDEELIAYAAHSAACNKAWLAGWHAGFNERN